MSRPEYKSTHFVLKVHFGIWDRCIMGFVTSVHWFLFADKMRLPKKIVTLCIVNVYLCGTVTGSYNYTYFAPTPKPLQCHEIRRINVRSTTECALYCMGNLYPCAGYVRDRKDIAPFQCDVCYIYDVKTPLVTIRASGNNLIHIPELNKETGEILNIDIVLHHLLLLFYYANMCDLDAVAKTSCRLYSNADAVYLTKHPLWLRRWSDK